MLSDAIIVTQKKRDDFHLNYMELSRKLEDNAKLHKQMQGKYDEILNCSDLFDDADNAIRRMIVAKLIRRVDIFKEGKIEVDFKIDINSLGISPLPSEEFIEVLKAG